MFVYNKIMIQSIVEFATKKKLQNHCLSFKLKFIIIGTLWCGAGSLAESCDDLGYNWETDK